MTNYEKELFNIIRENDNPERAALIAIQVFIAFLGQPEADPAQLVGDLRVSS